MRGQPLFNRTALADQELIVSARLRFEDVLDQGSDRSGGMRFRTDGADREDAVDQDEDLVGASAGVVVSEVRELCFEDLMKALGVRPRYLVCRVAGVGQGELGGHVPAAPEARG